MTNDNGLADRVKLLRSYGKREQWVTVCEEFGLNWRLNELAAAVAVAQLRRLDEFIAWRARVAAFYTERLAQVPAVRSISAGRSLQLVQVHRPAATRLRSRQGEAFRKGAGRLALRWRV